jgi:myo-inositol 2-dehydrogenase / D-chiro-inositol 1-dehydrogenase
MKPFRLGLIGAGRMGRTHLRALARSQNVRITAVAEPSAEQRALCAGGADILLYEASEIMLDARGIDGVLIAAPTKLHLGLVKQVLACGLPVLCEKPCGVSPEEASTADTLASDAGCPLQIAYWRRFVPALRHLRERIAAGELGDIYLATCYQWDGEAPPTSFRASSGGIFIDMGVHEFDQLRWLTGQDLVDLHAAPSRVSAHPVVAGDAESAQVLCRLSGGATGFVSLGRRFPEGDVSWTQVFGTRTSEECRFLWPPDAERSFLQALRDQAESFARYARGGPREGAQAADAVAALRAAHAASRVLSDRMEIT